MPVKKFLYSEELWQTPSLNSEVRQEKGKSVGDYRNSRFCLSSPVSLHKVMSSQLAAGGITPQPPWALFHGDVAISVLRFSEPAGGFQGGPARGPGGAADGGVRVVEWGSRRQGQQDSRRQQPCPENAGTQPQLKVSGQWALHCFAARGLGSTTLSCGVSVCGSQRPIPEVVAVWHQGQTY